MKPFQEEYNVRVIHSTEKKITLDEIIECVFGMTLEEVADSLNREIMQEAG